MNLTTITTGDGLIAAAVFAEKTTSKGIEFNVPATVIMTSEIALLKNNLDPYLTIAHLQKALCSNLRTAEEGMLQIEFLNQDINPGSSFLVLAVAAGWRYRGDKGFYKVAE